MALSFGFNVGFGFRYKLCSAFELSFGFVSGFRLDLTLDWARASNLALGLDLCLALELASLLI